VEGFLPIGALVSLRYWVTSGIFHDIHPAAPVLLLTFVGMSLLAKKSFCSWLCPVGTLSEDAWKFGRRLFGKNYRMWKWVDIPLRGVKYLLLLFFLKIILFDMPSAVLGAFLNAPYWAVSDVKMLHFFTRFSTTTLFVVLFLTGLSLFYRNFWCRYLCPYGALLGLFSVLSPMKIRRDMDRCNGCRKCSQACPAGLPVHSRIAVRSPECTGCLTCAGECAKTSRALHMAPPFWKGLFPGWFFPLLVVILFGLGVTTGMISGHWQTSLTYEDYQRLIPLTHYLNH
jgi:polyferredoxin